MDVTTTPWMESRWLSLIGRSFSLNQPLSNGTTLNASWARVLVTAHTHDCG